MHLPQGVPSFREMPHDVVLSFLSIHHMIGASSGGTTYCCLCFAVAAVLDVHSQLDGTA